MTQPLPDGADEQLIQDIVEVLEMKLNKVGSLHAARTFVLRTYKPAHVDCAIARLAERRKIFEDLDPAPIVDATLSWYVGPNANTSFYWQDYCKRLTSIGWTQPMIDAIDGATSRTVALLEHPGATAIATRGLVFGRVQSGKTAHFSGVIAKAADCGYKLFIVLSGITNSLRLQTQKRLSRDLSNLERPQAWFWLTKPDIDGDFVPQSADNVNHAYGGTAHRAIAVVKKQSDVLRKLIEWLGTGNQTLKRDCPVLIIDDEADQASLNTSKSMEREELTTINKRIVTLLEIFPKMAYVGYTATPFANVLVHPDYPENLYPRSFMYPLDPPETYFGATRIHGRDRLTHDEADVDTDGLPLIRIVPDDELKHLKPVSKKLVGFKFQVTPTLEMSLRYFFMATAARLFREAKGSRKMDFSTMMIHTSQRVAVHNQSEPLIRAAIAQLRKEVKDGHHAVWESLWKAEMAIVDPKKLKTRLGLVEFKDLVEHLFPAIDRCKVLVSNSNPNVETNVTFDEPGQIAIVIGGNTLSRGLTLEGLTVSFFVRSANAYDTILQMGRWYGYRPYYEDLPRIWMTLEMSQHFHDMATIEAEFREQLDEYRAKGLKPLEAAIRIRSLPKLQITAANKMRFAVTAEIDYGGARPQTIYFYRTDKTWLDRNAQAAKDLVAGLGTPKYHEGGHCVWKGRPSSEIITFLKAYRFHERSRELNQELLIQFINKRNAHGRLVTWNVVILGLDKERDGLGTFTFRDGLTIPCINRSRLVPDDGLTANIKALMAPSDILSDHPEISGAAIKDKKKPELFAMRKDDPSGVLILYPISKDSSCDEEAAERKKKDPKGPNATTRKDLQAAAHMIGVALVLPDEPGGGDFVRADLKPIESTVSAEPEDDDGGQHV